jgi:hypothetical protein
VGGDQHVRERQQPSEDVVDDDLGREILEEERAFVPFFVALTVAEPGPNMTEPRGLFTPLSSSVQADALTTPGGIL